MKIEELENKRILIVGYGKEGKATEAFLKKYVPTAHITIVDESQGEDYLNSQKDFDIAIKSPGVYPEYITIPHTTATNIFFSQVQGMTIGITGTKGKSTTTSLIYAMLKEEGKRVHLVGNIGTPLLTELLRSNTKEDIWVCELSSYQLGDLEYSPHIGVMVSLFPEHMNYHHSIEAYYKAKSQIVAHMTKEDYFVYNPAFGEIEAFTKNTKATRIPFLETLPFSQADIPLLGKHNYDNIRAAFTVAKLLHVSEAAIRQAVVTFQPLRHRLQNIGTFNGITFYDDAISTTPQSAIAALTTIPHVGSLMLGGQDRGYDFTPLIDVLEKYKIPTLIFFPESGTTMKELLEKRGVSTQCVLETSSMEEAVKYAYANTPKGMTCLLSTASPSYTIWKNFEEKGNEFQKWVKGLGK